MAAVGHLEFYWEHWLLPWHGCKCLQLHQSLARK